MEIERYENGVPSWVDLGSTDQAKSKEFYGNLFGWNCPEGPPEAGGYSVCDLGGKTVAGLGPQMNPAMPAVWVTYVNVDSADDTVAKVSANGGTLAMPPMDVMEAGRMALFSDPSGPSSGSGSPTSTRELSWSTNRARSAGTSSSPRTWTARRPSTTRCSGGMPRTRALRVVRRRTRNGRSPAGRSLG